MLLTDNNDHDQYVEDLVKKVSKRYDSVHRNVKIRGKKRMLGEIDLVCKRGKHTDLYEVKCSYRIHKARQQLQRAEKLMNVKHSRLFFYCGSSGRIEQCA